MKKVLFSLSALVAIALALPAAALAWGQACPFGGPAACGPMFATPSVGSRLAPLLVALAAGYGVVVLAVRQTRKLSLLGLILGWFILAVSAVGVGCVAGHALCLRCHRADACVPAGACPFIGGHTDKAADMKADKDKDGDEDGDDDDDDRVAAPAKSPTTKSPAAAKTEKKK